MKNVKFRGIPRKRQNSAVNSAAQIPRQTQIPRLGSKFRGPQKAVGPSDVFVAGIGGKNFSSDFKRYHKLSLSVLREFGFGTKRLMETRISQEFQAMTDIIRTKNGVEFDPSDVVGIANSNVIKSIVLGKREDYDNGPDEILQNFNLFMQNATVVIDVAPSLLKRIPYFGRKLEFCRKSISRMCEILEEDIEKLKENGGVECFVTSYLARVAPDYDREQLIYTVRDLVAAGFETTTTTLLWLLAFIANNPTIQERLQKDIDAVIPRNRLPSLDDQPKLPFVEATILETMRFRTVLPLSVPHLTLSDSEVCGYFIPANTKVSLLSQFDYNGETYNK